MKQLIKSVVLILILLLVLVHSQLQGQDEPAKDDSRSVQLPEKQVIKNIRVGPRRRPVLTRSYPGIEDIEIPYKEKFVIFELFHWDGYGEKEINYWYKLEGFDPEWRQVYGSPPSVAYSRLPPGSYVFKVKRSLVKEGEITDTVEESVKVIITPPFWDTWWFRLSELILVIGLIYPLYKFRLNRVKKYRQHELRMSQMQSRLTQAELKALKAQLHPHFLFNTLNVISSLMHENVEAADHVITRLGDLLRLMFSHSGQKMVRLKDEFEFIKIYLELHQVRFQDKLAVTLDTADETLEALVPNFLLQPLVENAVKHGISKDKNDNKILVRSQKKDNRLCLLIRDNGPGIPQLETGDFINIKGGFGLKNTLERLKIRYEADFKFKLENSPEGGLIVYIEMPYNTKADNE